jgi:rhomboid protease GluP
MIDLNHILLFISCVSPMVLLAQTWKRGGMNRGWRLAALAVLIVTGVSWVLLPNMAGFVGGGAWVALMLVPAIAMRKATELAEQQRYTSAHRLARTLRFLHPADGLLEQSEMLRALEVAQRGDFASALELVAPLKNNHTDTGRQATALSFRLRADWKGLLAWLRAGLPPGTMQTDVGLQPLYLRALGEMGALDELLLEFTTNAKAIISAPQQASIFDASLLAVLAFGGRVQALSNFLLTSRRKLSQDTKEFWRGTAELAAGETQAGRARLENLRVATRDGLIRAETAERLTHANKIAVAPLSLASDALLRRIEQSDHPSPQVFASRKTRPTTMVLIFIALNLAMFVAELAVGGSTNPLTLHRLGALEFFAVRFGGEYWRLLASLFLHYGPLHLLFNLYALFIIGPGLERAIGSIRFGLCYLLSGLGSSIGVLLLRTLGLNSAEQLVGASGCVMGLVGAWAGLLLRHRDTPMAGRRLKNILVIVAIQTAFDLSTPQISMAAHMSGLVTGVALGLILAPRSLRA